MKQFVIIILFFSASLYGETIYYNSNKSGMILDEIKESEVGEFYISKTSDYITWTNTFLYFENNIEIKRNIEFYTENFYKIKKNVYIEDDSVIEEIYTDNLLREIRTIENDILISKDIYTYKNNTELYMVESVDSEMNILYVDKYYRNPHGSLRKLIRNSPNGYQNLWFYKNGTIIESWFIKDIFTTRFKYNLAGKLLEQIEYENEDIVSNEVFEYSDNGTVIRSNKVSGIKVFDKQYNSDGKIIEVRILENNILVQKTNFEYVNDLISKEIITGHGKREETIYERNDSDDISSVFFYINGELKKVKLIESEDSEIYEYYRNKQLYLKEFIFQGERIRRDLYLDGKLFKSEKNNE